MTEFPKGITFKYSWRKYQQRALNELESHLTDGHLHVIAPPGSGKTILGLEVALRLNKPTLILAPTIAIRNQWIQRFCELFLQTPLTPDWISRDIRNPELMTVVTYQGLHAACNNLLIEEKEIDEDEETDENDKVKSDNKNLDKIVEGLKAQNVKTIVVDEAHHLKKEWWQTLTKVKEKLEPVIVGLTATPPYDVSPNEWQRYLQLNGPVDTEISVPELVIEGDLCPHQDYVYFTFPTEKEKQNLNEFRQNIEKLFQEIKKDEILIKAIENHPAWLSPLENLDWIYNNLSCYSASLIFLSANAKEIPKSHLEVIGDQKIGIPPLDYNWIEILLEFYLFEDKERFKGFEEHQQNIEKKLKRYGAIERLKISFTHNRKATGFLASSIGKLNAIKEIVDFEYKQLGRELRLVILSDYIRKELYTSEKENNIELNKIGVIPIFEKLRRENSAGLKIGVLTGSVIIIPKSAYPLFEERALNAGITKITSSPVPFDNDYILINQTEQLKHDIVHIITQIFQDGEIEVLIGTKSLLGEGWDAPAVNTLILASFVGSFVLSNQMRGRAIRTQKGNPGKTGNIWHLVCIDPYLPTGGDDFDLLQRKFKSFVGISTKGEPRIENGIGRLNFPQTIRLIEDIENNNRETFNSAADREALKQHWKTALESGAVLVEEIKLPFQEEKVYKKVKDLYYKKTIAYLIAELIAGLLTLAASILTRLWRYMYETPSYFLYWIAIIAGICAIYFAKPLYTAFRLYLKYRDIAKDIRQIGEALLNSLIKVGSVRTDISKFKVISSVDDLGAVHCHLEGGTTFEKSTLMNNLKEVIGRIDNPRYVIIRKGLLMFLIKQKDYHTVPEILGQNKTIAEYFRDQWGIYVGKCDLIFTRTVEGRKLLLKSRLKSLSAQFGKQVEHVNKWK